MQEALTAYDLIIAAVTLSFILNAILTIGLVLWVGKSADTNRKDIERNRLEIKQLENRIEKIIDHTLPTFFNDENSEK